MITFRESEADVNAANEPYEQMSIPHGEARRRSQDVYEVIQADGFPGTKTSPSAA